MRDGAGARGPVETGLKTLPASTRRLRGRLRSWRDVVIKQTAQRPVRSVALAAGAGFLLGGGLFSSLTARIVAVGLKAGVRFALVPLMTQRLISMGEELLPGEEGADPAEADPDKRGHGKGSKSSIGITPKRHLDNKETHS